MGSEFNPAKHALAALFRLAAMEGNKGVTKEDVIKEMYKPSTDLETENGLAAIKTMFNKLDQNRDSFLTPQEAAFAYRACKKDFNLKNLHNWDVKSTANNPVDGISEYFGNRNYILSHSASKDIQESKKYEVVTPESIRHGLKNIANKLDTDINTQEALDLMRLYRLGLYLLEDITSKEPKINLEGKKGDKLKNTVIAPNAVTIHTRGSNTVKDGDNNFILASNTTSTDKILQHIKRETDGIYSLNSAKQDMKSKDGKYPLDPHGNAWGITFRHIDRFLERADGIEPIEKVFEKLLKTELTQADIVGLSGNDPQHFALKLYAQQYLKEGETLSREKAIMMALWDGEGALSPEEVKASMEQHKEGEGAIKTFKFKAERDASTKTLINELDGYIAEIEKIKKLSDNSTKVHNDVGNCLTGTAFELKEMGLEKLLTFLKNLKENIAAYEQGVMDARRRQYQAEYDKSYFYNRPKEPSKIVVPTREELATLIAKAHSAKPISTNNNNNDSESGITAKSSLGLPSRSKSLPSIR